MTPAMARQMLELNTKNRKMRARGVEFYKGIIARGEWQLTHQGVAVDVNGVLLDGQHRLTAIAEGDTAVEILVTTGLPPEAMTAVDNGITRSLGDHLHLTARQAALLRAIHNIDNNTIGSGRLTAAQGEETLVWCRTALHAVCDLPGVFTTRNSTAVQLAVLVHYLNRHPSVIEQYIDFQHLNLEKLKPIQVILLRQMMDGVARAGNSVQRWDLTARAWKAFDPEHSHDAKLLVSDPAIARAEMHHAIKQYRKRVGK